jgi:hypothetical protein
MSQKPAIDPHIRRASAYAGWARLAFVPLVHLGSQDVVIPLSLRPGFGPSFQPANDPQ